MAAHTAAWKETFQASHRPTAGGALLVSNGGGTVARTLGCARLDNIDNTHAPPELYGAVTECVKHEQYADGIALFALAGLYSNFDAARVADKTAGQAGQILVMGMFSSVPAASAEKFRAMAASIPADKPTLERICTGVRKVGPPSYYPTYMVANGMNAVISDLQGIQKGPGLEPNFDAARTWSALQASYLSCPPAGQAR